MTSFCFYISYFFLAFFLIQPFASAKSYEDDRPIATCRINAKDQGVILRHGDQDAEYDIFGARDVYVFKHHDTYFLHYDAAGPKGWLVSLATTNDLNKFTKKGPVLDLGYEGAFDSASASYGTVYLDGQTFWMYYLGTQTVSPPPDLVPQGPYYLMKAKSLSPNGPWLKDLKPSLAPSPNTYYDLTVSPGQIVEYKGKYLQFFSAGQRSMFGVQRTIGIARADKPSGPWLIDRTPIISVSEQIENTSLYYQSSNNMWFMFVNHVSLKGRTEFTDAIWVYWTHDIEHWDSNSKAIVLDNHNSSWSKTVIGLPSVLPINDKLAIFYDGIDLESVKDKLVGQHPDSRHHMERDIGLAWLELPIKTPINFECN